jgi:uncharacterized membrane protein YsdA (DUF1294 family)
MTTVYLFLSIYALASTLCFAFYAHDKWAARTRRRRTSERTLLTLGLLCGWPGAWLAQSWLRHKSVKQPFRAWFFATVVLNLAILSGIIYLYIPWE